MILKNINQIIYIFLFSLISCKDFSKMEKLNCGFINQKSEIIIPYKYQAINQFSEGLAAVNIGQIGFGKISGDRWLTGFQGKWGYIDSNGKFTIGLKYDLAYDFKNGLAKIKKDGKYGIINKLGKKIIMPQYNRMYSFKNGLAKIQKDNKWGFIDTKGKIIIDIIYDEISEFYEGLALFKKDKLYGYINDKNKVIIPPKFEEASLFKNKKSIVKEKGKYYLIDFHGNKIHSYPFKKFKIEYSFLIKDFLVILKDGKISFADISGNIFSKNSYEHFWDQKECNGCGIGKSGNNYYIINDLYQEILLGNSTSGLSFSEGLYFIKKNNKYCYINKKGETVIDCEFERANNFDEGLASVKKNNKFGFIDKKGKVIIPFNYDYADSFNNGLAEVQRNGKTFKINKKGEEKIELWRNFSTKYKNFKEGKMGICNSTKYFDFLI